MTDPGEKGCFITTAVTEMNGERDDGPTLTKLRRFRDSYMQETPARRRLVEHYYEIAPKITRAIPEGSRTWPMLNAAIGKIVDRIDSGNHEGAMEGYARMMDRLSARYLRGTGGAGPRPVYEGRGTGIESLDALRAMAGPRPRGLQFRYDRKAGRVRQAGAG